MFRMIRATLACSFVLCATTLSAANWPDRPTLQAVRAQVSPVIDADLSDPAWQAAPEFTDFTQHDPHDGQPGSQRTSVRIVYDDDAIYFGIEADDAEAPTALLVRRDEFAPSDFVSINIDPQLDRVSGNAFTLTPANVQIDSVLFNDIGEDGSWDGVWQSETKITPRGWVAEVRIPYSQLRFPDKPVHVWGLNITRRTMRTNEMVRIVNTRKGDTGFVSHFADIVGLEGIRRGRPLELVPYVVGRFDLRSSYDARNPFLESTDHRGEIGLDLKYALTPSLTLTGTINPDFGQVEVDPAVVNLSEFETFYPEKRPFFTEGLNVFQFGDTPATAHINFISAPDVFYSRRIGRAPQVHPRADYAAMPSDSTILGAAKLTGRVGDGWTIGLLSALTANEEALYANEGGAWNRQRVEPMTNYFVARATKDLREGARIGMMLTSVDRSLDADTDALRESAWTGGLDGYATFGNGWIAEGELLGSHVQGSEEAIALTQLSPARYFNRPDAGHVEFDPTREALRGWGGRAQVSKNTGVWRPNFQVHAYSPGYETNDLGFMQRTDQISASAIMVYVNEHPTARFRERSSWFGTWQTRNFDGDTLERGAIVNYSGVFANYTGFEIQSAVIADAFDDRHTRGGPVVRTPGGWTFDARYSTDERKRFQWEFGIETELLDDDSWEREYGIELTARPAANLRFSLEPTFVQSFRPYQYVTAFDDASAAETYGRRYVFAELEQTAFELGTRVDWTLTNHLSFQLYLQPFIASGDYEEPTALVEARTRDYAAYAYDVQPRDFNFRSVRGSAVVRWEFRPGSALYVVWNENRAETEEFGDFRFGRDLRAIYDAPSHDVFLVKVSYWLPM